MRALRVPLVLFTLLVGTAAAAAEDAEPSISDPAGDAWPPGPASGWGDLTSVHFAPGPDDTFSVHIQVAAGDPLHADGILGVHVTTPTGHYLLAYGAALADDGPHRRAFWCPEDGEGNVVGDCPNLPGVEQEGNSYVLSNIPRDQFGLDGNAVIRRPWAETGHHVLLRTWVQVDKTDVGMDFTFLHEETTAVAIASDTTSREAKGRMEPFSTPALIAALASVGVAAAVVFSRLRRV